MPSPIAEHLADRFAADAAALRARADAVRAGGTRAPGPSPRALLTMAEACDRVRLLFADTADDDAVRAMLPRLAGLVAGARNEEERHVYAGAVSRASQALDGDDEDGEDGEDAEDDA